MIKKIIVYTVFLIFVFSMTPFMHAQYEGQPELISLDLKGMDIRDVLKILSQKSGLNIVADNDVKGTVAIYIKDVDVMDALDIITLTNGLAYEQEGLLVRVMSDKTYERLHGIKFGDRTKIEIVKLNYAKPSNVANAIERMKTKVGNVIPDDGSSTVVLIDIPENIKEMKKAISEIDIPLITEVFSLNYAEAELIKGKLEQMISENRGSIRFDERTNKIVVKDTAKKIEDIRKVIEAFDEKTREVSIDANIIQVTLSDKYSYGIDWADVASMGGLRLTADTNLATGLTSTTPSTLTIATTGGNYTTVLSLLKTFGETNVLSRPRITVLDKEEAKILVGSKEVYVTSEVTTTEGGTYHTTDNVEFVDVGVALTVTPIINSAGFVTMRIKPEVSSTDATKTVQLTNPDGSTRSVIPYVTTSEAETTVVVKDSTTLIIGGLMKDTIVDHKEKVPFLSDLPILGKLFTTTGKSKEKTELVIFLTPHIIEGDKTTKEAEAALYEWNKKKDIAKIEERERPRLKPSRWQPGPKEEIKAKRWTPVFESRAKKKDVQRVKREEKVVPISKETGYKEYSSIIKQEIDSIARRQDVSGLKGEVELQFTLDKDGFITRGPVVLNKPDLKLVRAAINGVKSATPFPPFPMAMRKKEAEFFVVVRYE